ncbi:RICIN domain-containing protein [Streptomyces sp. TRM68367]|uniref:RICIN domain-containing protein n=1 Tax=Streptomyces sp. TRM68367 TaxID=2758415 RepID=UPI00165AD0AF|nr:RICIN domain-containing protein [Streptomyces sp. TRM68367]MBC9724845.1 ricin-type beta-trefoil lectin domain protein [Streptomyces sp. TRM68367]
MPTPHPPRPPSPPPGGDAGESDESLATRLRGLPEGEAAHSVGLLMARHWQSVHDYAVICLAASATPADMVTAAAFRRVLDRVTQGEPGLALRPRLLLAVRDTVREWSSDDRIAAVLPALQKPAGGRGMRSAKSMTPENRVLVDRSFQALPGAARCLLWHTEVEAESITVPAGLLGMDTDSAAAMLEQARDKFREGHVQAHRELAPTKDCRFYNRLLDVPIRRGGAQLPDVQQHLVECRYCRQAAEQLGHFEGGLGTLLAEAVLGWGARRYLDSRPGRASVGGGRRGAQHGGRRTARGRRAAENGRHRMLARIPAQVRRIPLPLPRSPRALLSGVGAVSAGVLATVLIVSVWSYDDGAADPAASTSAVGGSGALPSPPDASDPGAAGLPTPPRQTRLRNLAADLCLDVRGEPESGAGTELAACSTARTQQWTYEDDGLLRSVAEPDLCLDSHKDAGVVILDSCADEDDERGDDVRYDLTVQGELLPRWDEQLVLTSTTQDQEAEIVVKVRDRSAEQRWRTDPVPTTAGSLSIAESQTPGARAVDFPGGEE